MIVQSPGAPASLDPQSATGGDINAASRQTCSDPAHVLVATVCPFPGPGTHISLVCVSATGAYPKPRGPSTSCASPLTSDTPTSSGSVRTPLRRFGTPTGWQ